MSNRHAQPKDIILLLRFTSGFRGHTSTHGQGRVQKYITSVVTISLGTAQAHPEDVIQETCAICGGTDEAATDWVSCDSCNNWVHFSCDGRSHLGTFKDYAKGNGATYNCVNCSNAKRA